MTFAEFDAVVSASVAQLRDLEGRLAAVIKDAERAIVAVRNAAETLPTIQRDTGDQVATWLNGAYAFDGPNVRVSATDVYARYIRDGGRVAMAVFGKRVRACGVQVMKSNGRVFYVGLRAVHNDDI